VIGVDADVCANGDEGLRLRGGSLDLSGGEIRANMKEGISASDASMLKVRGVTVSDNGGNGMYLTRVDDLRIEDSTVHHNIGDGLTVLDSPAPKVMNNLVYDNSAAGILISGDLVGSSDAEIGFNTLYRNGNRGVVIGGGNAKPPSTNAVVIGNIFQANGSWGLQVSLTSTVLFVGDYNLSFANDYSGIDPGPHDIFFDPLFVAPDSGDFHLSQRAAGQGAASPAVNAGSTTATASGMATKTTRTDKVVDSGIVDLGYHYLP